MKTRIHTLFGRRLRKWAQDGASLREIARRLNEAGVLSKRGGKWSHRTVGYVLRNALYEDCSA